jgi:dihydrodipicolinate synthase/N-acetylneuraminate lyase
MNGKDSYEVQGIVPIVNTPFDRRGAIDFDSLDRLIVRSLADGVAGFIVPAVASEVDALSGDERRALVAAVVAATAGRGDVIAGVSTANLRDSLRLAEHAVSAGCETVLCRVPDQLADDFPALRAFFGELSDVGMTTLMIQDLSWGGDGLTIDQIRTLYEEIDAFRAIKIETVLPSRKYSAVLDATDNGLHVSCGWGLGQMIEALDRGAKAFNSTAINFPFVRVFELYKGGDRENARRVFARIAPFLLFCQQHIDISIHMLKRYCVAVGVFDTDVVRPGTTGLDEYQERVCDELIRDAIRVEQELHEELRVMA